MRDTAALAAQSDPECNWHFRRKWAEAPPLKRERQPRLSDLKLAKYSNSGTQNSPEYSLPNLLSQRARAFELREAGR